jgi:hypothetical protein
MERGRLAGVDNNPDMQKLPSQAENRVWKTTRQVGIGIIEKENEVRILAARCCCRFSISAVDFFFLSLLSFIPIPPE